MTPEQLTISANSLCGLADVTEIPVVEIAESLELCGIIEPEEREAIIHRIASV